MPKPNILQQFLQKHAEETIITAEAVIQYAEDVNPDAANETWLESQTSYIWKVGVLTLIDRNKSDWAYLFIGHQRKPKGDCQFIGKLYWEGGENDDPAASLERYIKCAQAATLLFQP